MGVSASHCPGATHSPQDMLNPAFIPFMSTIEKKKKKLHGICINNLHAFASFYISSLQICVFMGRESGKKEMFALLIAQHKSSSFVNKRKLADIFAYSCGESFFPLRR